MLSELEIRKCLRTRPKLNCHPSIHISPRDHNQVLRREVEIKQELLPCSADLAFSVSLCRRRIAVFKADTRLHFSSFDSTVTSREYRYVASNRGQIKSICYAVSLTFRRSLTFSSVLFPYL